MKKIRLLITIFILFIAFLILIVLVKRDFTFNQSNLYEAKLKDTYLYTYKGDIYSFKMYDLEEDGLFIKKYQNKDINVLVSYVYNLDEDFKNYQYEYIDGLYIAEKTPYNYLIYKELDGSYLKMIFNINGKRLSIKDLKNMLSNIKKISNVNLKKSLIDNNKINGFLKYKDKKLNYEGINFIEINSYLDNILMLKKEGEFIILEFTDQKANNFIEINDLYLNYYGNINLINEIKFTF